LDEEKGRGMSTVFVKVKPEWGLAALGGPWHSMGQS